jgi:hypothetical protein
LSTSVKKKCGNKIIAAKDKTVEERPIFFLFFSFSNPRHQNGNAAAAEGEALYYACIKYRLPLPSLAAAALI